MRSGTLAIAEFADFVRPLRALAIRLALYWQDDHWTLGVADAHVGAAHGLPTWKKYRYREFAFAAGRVQGSVVADWLQHKSGEFAGLAFTTPELRNVNWRQKSSQPGYDLIPIRRPYIEYAVYGPGRPGNFVGSEVAGEAGPYFESWRTACASLLYDRWDSGLNANIPNEVLTLRIESAGPWIDNVHVGPSLVRIAIAGPSGRPARLQIVTPKGPLGNFSVSRSKKTFEIPAALPPGVTHVVLVRGDDVIDSRDVSMTQLGPQRVQQEGVTYDPPSRMESIESLIAGGEGPTVEFKEDLSGEKIYVAVSAFANTSGGAIFVGVDNHGNAKGIPNAKVAQLADTIINQLHQRLRPFPPVTTEVAVISSRTVLLLWVDAAQSDPVGVGDTPVAYYVRRGASNFYATPEEIGALVRSRNTPLSPFATFGRSGL
jgi:hypothetical protein